MIRRMIIFALACMCGVALGQAFLTPFDTSLLQLAGGSAESWDDYTTWMPNEAQSEILYYWRPSITTNFVDVIASYELQPNGQDSSDIITVAGSGYYNDGQYDNNISATNGLAPVNFTICFWLNPTDMSPTDFIHFENQDTSKRFWLYLDASNNINYRLDNRSGISTGVVVPTNVWSHVAFSLDSISGIEVYLNGTMAYTNGSITTRNGMSVENQHALMNAPGISYSSLKGYLDEYIIFENPITSNAIYQIYETSNNLEFSTR